MHFTVTKKDVNKLTGFCDIELEFSYGTSLHTDKKSFAKEENADAYINKCMRDFIKLSVEKYVKHKKILSERGDYYRTDNKLESIDTCWRGVQFIQDLSLAVSCQMILKMEWHLKHILPSALHKDYCQSFETLNTMLIFCKTHQVEPD